MKAACLLLLTLCWVNLGLDASPLPWGDDVARPASSSAGARRASGHVGPAAQKAHRPAPLPSTHSASGNHRNAKRPGTNQSAGPVKGAFVRIQTARGALPGPTSNIARPAAPLLNNARHRGPNPAVVGGSAEAAGKNAGAINGSTMKRRP